MAYSVFSHWHWCDRFVLNGPNVLHLPLLARQLPVSVAKLMWTQKCMKKFTLLKWSNRCGSLRKLSAQELAQGQTQASGKSPSCELRMISCFYKLRWNPGNSVRNPFGSFSPLTDRSLTCVDGWSQWDLFLNVAKLGLLSATAEKDCESLDSYRLSYINIT